jgi:hypothetical protein
MTVYLHDVIGSLHDLACKSAEECACTPIYVREAAAGERWGGYNSMTAVEAESDRIAHGVPVVLNPLPGRRSASSRLSR